MGPGLSSEIIADLKARAADPVRRTDMAALGAASVDAADMFEEQRARLAARSPGHQRKVREYLEGMNTPLAGMISNAATSDGSQAVGLLGMLRSVMGSKPLYASMDGRPVALTGKPQPTIAQAPVSDGIIAWVEGELGFALPADLKTFYTEVANGEVGPGDGIYAVSGLIMKWRELTEEPAGPQGQAWPQNLLPILGSDELFSIDRETRRIVYWDVDELELDESRPADDLVWVRSFKPVAESLEAWLQRWLSDGSR